MIFQILLQEKKKNVKLHRKLRLIPFKTKRMEEVFFEALPFTKDSFGA